MYSTAQIRHMSDEAAKRASRLKKQPYVPYSAEEVEGWLRGGSPIPNIGSLRPKGWKLVDEWFVDISGFGSENEPAMTQRRFIQRVKEQVEAGKNYGYAIIEVGQFQGYVGVFEKE